MRSAKLGNTHVLRIDHSEDVISSIKAFCAESEIQGATFIAQGGVIDPVFSFFDMDTKVEETQRLSGEFEIASLTGTISVHKGEVEVIANAVLNDSKFHVVGGRLLEGQARVAVEVIMDRIPGSLERDIDRKFKTLLIDL